MKEPLLALFMFAAPVDEPPQCAAGAQWTDVYTGQTLEKFKEQENVQAPLFQCVHIDKQE